MPYEKKLIQFNDRQNLGFSQTGSQFIYACALDLNKREEGRGKTLDGNNSLCGDFCL